MSKRKTPPRGKNGRFKKGGTRPKVKAAKRAGYIGRAASKSDVKRLEKAVSTAKNVIAAAARKPPPYSARTYRQALPAHYGAGVKKAIAASRKRKRKAASKAKPRRSVKMKTIRVPARATPKKRASGMYKGKRRAPYRVRAYGVRPHFANPSLPPAILAVARTVGGAVLAAGAMYGSGVLMRKLTLTKWPMVGVLAGVGAVAGAAISVVSPAAGATVATPAFLTAIGVAAGAIAPTGAAAKVQNVAGISRGQLGELRRIPPGGFANYPVGELVQQRDFRQLTAGSRDQSVNRFVERFAGAA